MATATYTRSTLGFHSTNPNKFLRPKHLIFPILSCPNTNRNSKPLIYSYNPLLINNNGGDLSQNTNHIQPPTALKQTNLLSPLTSIFTNNNDTKAPTNNLITFKELCARVFAIVSLFSLRVEKVPYSNKYRLAFKWLDFLRSKMGQFKIKELEKEYQILSPSHAKSLKAVSMAREVAQAMHNGLGLKQDCTVRAYSPKHSNNNIYGALAVGVSWDIKKLRDNDEIAKYGRGCSTKHLEGREWRVIVTDAFIDNAGILPDGTIVIHEGLIDSCSDEELAFTLAHEFGHAIARHPQHLPMYIVLWALKILPRSWTPFHHALRLAEAVLKLIEKPLEQRDELEADHIGMMLIACAGYDPQIVPRHWRKQGHNVSNYFSTHPSNNKRAESLEKPEKMKKALALYREVKAARDTV